MTEKCITCGSEKVIGTSHNEALHTDIKVPTHLLPLLVHALAIERNCAMMSTSFGGARVSEEIEDLRKEVKSALQFSPKLFKDYMWVEICHRASKGHDLQVTITSDRPHWTVRYYIEIEDMSGAVWPGYHNATKLKSESAESKDQVETEILHITEELNRRAPMQA